MVKLNYRKHELILSWMWIVDATNDVQCASTCTHSLLFIHHLKNLCIHKNTRVSFSDDMVRCVSVFMCAYTSNVCLCVCVGKFFGCDKINAAKPRKLTRKYTAKAISFCFYFDPKQINKQTILMEFQVVFVCFAACINYIFHSLMFYYRWKTNNLIGSTKNLFCF